MPLTIFEITSVTPRGGAAGTVVTVAGDNFGIVTGQIIIDPLGQAIAVAATSWVDDEIVFTVPALPVQLLNRFSTIRFVKATADDAAETPFWVPAVPPTNTGQDYQWPNFEAGTSGENADDPRVLTAADFNRVFDQAKSGGAGSLPPLIGVQFAALMENPIGVASWNPITQDMILPAFMVGLTLAAGSASRELGENVVNPTFNATYNRPPALAILTDSDGFPAQIVTALPNPITRPNTYVKSAIGATTVFDLAANETGGPTRNAQVTMTWLPRVFFGVGPAGGLTEAQIEALAGNALAGSRARTFAVAPGAAEKIYYAYPTAFGLGTFSVGGFAGGFLPPIVVNVTNPFGVVLPYYLYESALLGLGATTVVVT
jgi:hypothetical protein